MKPVAATDESPARAYARLLLSLHDLISAGRGDDPEADAVRDQMDSPWYAMTEAEQERVGGLSEDLYALAENDRRLVKMSAEERQQWSREFGAAFEAGAWDRALELLRHPPDDAAADLVALSQAECWEHLGVPEVALRFMRAATRLGTSQAASVLRLWFPRGGVRVGSGRPACGRGGPSPWSRS
jgi:hypothetical protein